MSYKKQNLLDKIEENIDICKQHYSANPYEEAD